MITRRKFLKVLGLGSFSLMFLGSLFKGKAITLQKGGITKEPFKPHKCNYNSEFTIKGNITTNAKVGDFLWICQDRKLVTIKDNKIVNVKNKKPIGIALDGNKVLLNRRVG